MKGFSFSGISPVKGRIRGLSESAGNHNRAHDKHDKGEGPDPHAQKVDPDAPGTKGTEGYEPEVKYEDLDEKGKKLWHKVRGTEYKPSKESNKEKDR